MKHEEMRHKLSEFIDGAVTPGEKETIELHLKTCTECSDALRELRKTIEHIHAVEEVESPAWMTQKIMAKVRAEQEAKTGLWQRVFAPFLRQFPVQAVAVLFLSVTAFYLYTTMHPTKKYAEAPIERFAKREADDASRAAPKHKAPEIAERREKKVAQVPDYKSLDMKYEYEKPAPPLPAAPGVEAVATREEPAALAPAPARREATIPVKDEADLEKRAFALKAKKSAAPFQMAEQAAQKSSSSDALSLKPQEAASRKKQDKAAADVHYSLASNDISAAISKVRLIIRDLEGAVIKHDVVTNAQVLTVSLDSKKFALFTEKLKTIDKKAWSPDSLFPLREGPWIIEIMIVGNNPPSR
ncbi:MAG: DUF2275 domain-containing protein [Nitrospirota bacterium]